jgi:hypothetical protein
MRCGGHAVRLCRPWVSPWGLTPTYGLQTGSDKRRYSSRAGGRKFGWDNLTTWMVAGDGAVIFPTGTYYPQVHPQVVENPAGRAEAFDQTSSHVTDVIFTAVNAGSIMAPLNPSRSSLLAEQNSAFTPSDTLLGYP